MEIKVILNREEVNDILADRAAGRLQYAERDKFEPHVHGSYGYGDVTVTFTQKKVEPAKSDPAPAIEKVNAGTPFETLAPDAKPSRKSIEVITDVALVAS